MEERLLKYARLVDAGSFTKASQELHISQPALSTAIHKLERELRVTLLVRGPRSFTLTEAGKLAYASAKQLSVHKSNLLAALAEAAGQPVSLIVGMIDSVASMLFSAETDVHGAEPQTSLSIMVNNSRYLVQAALQHKVDAAFVVEQPRPSSRLLETSFVASEPLVLVCQAAERKAVASAVHQGQLPNFISYDLSSTTHQIIAEALQRVGLEPEARYFSTSPEVMLRLVLQRKGAAVLPYTLVKDLAEQHVLSLVPLPASAMIERRIAIVKLAGKKLPVSVVDMTDTIKRVAHDHHQAAMRLLRH
jgi:DNA-binding transcriptional LysR family regulator